MLLNIYFDTFNTYGENPAKEPPLNSAYKLDFFVN
ncbi:hypothetical protein HE1_00771 [Holospora elegans E1]|uniref:Uncharacterized protein n=1 Tax=Holospora elegans E1 TaxID=1427503 RepID=A0A023E0C8_9PROT|nr:hypothetical protein HE1_00771 [Holospora elegans E1]